MNSFAFFQIGSSEIPRPLWLCQKTTVIISSILCMCRKLSDKGHKRTNSDGTVKLNLSSSCQDLAALETATTTAAATKGNDSWSPRRRSVIVTTADKLSLSSSDYNMPEVCTLLYGTTTTTNAVGWKDGACCKVEHLNRHSLLLLLLLATAITATALLSMLLL